VQGASPELFEPGDVLVVPHGDAYYLADPPDAQPGYGSDEALAFFRQMAAGELPTLINEGGGESARAQFICGFLGCDRRPLNPVLSALPAMLHLRTAPQRGDRLQHLVEFALSELREPSSGGREVLQRLAELMFVEVARRHLDSIDDRDSGWLAGLHDPLVARALALLHGDVARRWTLETLARAVGGSRSVLAERFMHFVGQPPMRYLAQWRLQLAGGLLDAPGAKVVAVADAVGYESAPAFSRAFKKSTGLAPAQWRRRASGG
jgi:AraC-like DNA-binding protein